MSLTPYGGDQLPSRWSFDEFGRYLSFQAYRMYFWLSHIAPIVVKTQLQQMERNIVNNIPFVSDDGKRDIKRWLGHYDPSYFQGSIDSVRMEHGVYQGGQVGMNICVTFTVRNMKNVEGKVAVYFYLNDGRKLRDLNNSHNTPDGQVAVSAPFTPGFDNALYTDFVVFIPLSELHLGSGRFSLYFDIEIYDVRSNTHFSRSPSYYYFDYWQNP